MTARRRCARAGLASLALMVSVAAALLVLPPSPAGAHALLLRTVPAPQTTVKTAPKSVRLEFSERVDVAFGAIRVYDVDGHRVDSGQIQAASGGRAVVVPLKALKNGTYTVTWRAVSADGHPVRGGFVFYVGSASSISAAAIPTDRGAGRVVGWLFGTARFAWFSGFLIVVGAIVVRRWVWTPALAASIGGAATEADATEANTRFRARFRQVVLGGWALLVVAGVLRLIFEAATVSGLGLGKAMSGSVLGDVLKTSYGQLWRWEFALAVALVLPLVALTARRRPAGGTHLWLVVALILGGTLAVATARNGHARTDPHPAIATASVALHLLAVAVWVGGLLTLLVAGVSGWRKVAAERRPRLLGDLIGRFSTLAMVAVVVVTATGTVNSWFDFAAPSDLWRNTYGRTVLAKIALMAVALALAARHRFVLPRRLASGDVREVRRFERSGAVEAVVLVVVVALAAGLVAMVPGRSLRQGRSGPVNLEQSAGAGISVQLFLDDTETPPQIHVTFVGPGGLAEAGVADAKATVHPPAGAAAPIQLRLLSPGHYVGDIALAGRGRYGLDVRGQDNQRALAVTFRFTYRGRPTA